MDSTTTAFKGAATIDIEHLVLDADDLAAATVDFFRTVLRSPALGRGFNDDSTFTLLALNLQTYLSGRERFVTTPTAASLTPTLNPNVVGETSFEPFSADKAAQIARKAMKRA